MVIYVVQLYVPYDLLRKEVVCHNREDAIAQRKDFVKWIQSKRMKSARVAQIEVVVPQADDVLDKLSLEEIDDESYLEKYNVIDETHPFYSGELGIPFGEKPSPPRSNNVIGDILE